LYKNKFVSVDSNNKPVGLVFFNVCFCNFIIHFAVYYKYIGLYLIRSKNKSTINGLRSTDLSGALGFPNIEKALKQNRMLINL
jgi:hypothetical protein